MNTKEPIEIELLPLLQSIRTLIKSNINEDDKDFLFNLLSYLSVKLFLHNKATIKNIIK